jgi:hypothetical protein
MPAIFMPVTYRKPCAALVAHLAAEILCLPAAWSDA